MRNAMTGVVVESPDERQRMGDLPPVAKCLAEPQPRVGVLASLLDVLKFAEISE